MDVKKEWVSEDIECEIIEVVDLMAQVKKDAGQTTGEFTIHWLQLDVCLSVKFEVIVNLIYKKIQIKVFILIESIHVHVHVHRPVFL